MRGAGARRASVVGYNDRSMAAGWTGRRIARELALGLGLLGVGFAVAWLVKDELVSWLVRPFLQRMSAVPERGIRAIDPMPLLLRVCASVTAVAVLPAVLSRFWHQKGRVLRNALVSYLLLLAGCALVSSWLAPSEFARPSVRSKYAAGSCREGDFTIEYLAFVTNWFWCVLASVLSAHATSKDGPKWWAFGLAVMLGICAWVLPREPRLQIIAVLLSLGMYVVRALLGRRLDQPTPRSD